LTNLTAARSSPTTIYRELTGKTSGSFDTSQAWDNSQAHKLRQDLWANGKRPEALYTGASAATVR